MFNCVYRYTFTNVTQEIYTKLGYYIYDTDGKGISGIVEQKGKHNDWIYFGQINSTGEFNGYGIWVYANGDTINSKLLNNHNIVSLKEAGKME